MESSTLLGCQRRLSRIAFGRLASFFQTLRLNLGLLKHSLVEFDLEENGAISALCRLCKASLPFDTLQILQARPQYQQGLDQSESETETKQILILFPLLRPRVHLSFY